MTADEKNKMYQAESKYFMNCDELRKLYTKDEIRQTVIEYVDNYDKKIEPMFSDEYYESLNNDLEEFRQFTPKQKKVYLEYITKKINRIGGVK